MDDVLASEDGRAVVFQCENVSSDEGDMETEAAQSASIGKAGVSLDDIAAKLIRDKFLLTALELHTELVEHGRELPRLQDFFSNPGNFERQGDSCKSEPSPSLPRTSSIQTFDSLDFARYSDDGDRQVDEKVAVLEFELRKARETIKSLRANLTEAAESEVTTPDNQYDHLREDDSIKPHELRALNFLVNEYLLRHNYKLTSITFSDENDEQDFEDWDDVGLNIAKPPSLLHVYRDSGRHIIPPAVTVVSDKAVQVDFSEESSPKSDIPHSRESFDVTAGFPSAAVPPQSCHVGDREVKPASDRGPGVATGSSEASCSTPRNKVSTVSGDGPVCLYCGQNRLVGAPEEEELHPPPVVHSVPDDVSYMVANEPWEETDSASERLSSRELVECSDADIDHTENDDASSHIPVEGGVITTPVQACARHVTLSFHDKLVELCRMQKAKQGGCRLASEVSEVFDSSDKVVLMLARCLPHIVPNVILAKREELIPVILGTISLHPSDAERDQLLNILFNLIKRPDDEQRSMILSGFVAVARCIGSTRVESELLPQCWEQINHKYLERRLLVAEACGVLIPYIPVCLQRVKHAFADWCSEQSAKNEIRSSLVWSMLQQMLTDKSELVRESVVKSLSSLVASIEDIDKYSQGLQLLVLSLCDASHRVVAAALQLLLPSLAYWARDVNKLESELVTGLIGAIADRMSALLKGAVLASPPSHVMTQEQKDVISLVDAFLYLLPWLFVALLESVPGSSKELAVEGDNRPVDVGRFPPFISPLCDINVIIGSEKEAAMFIRHYEDYIGEEWYETWPKLDWITRTMLPGLVELSFSVDLFNPLGIHAFCQLFYWLSRIFGHQFMLTKVKPVFQQMLRVPGDDLDESFGKSVATRGVVPVYAAGVLAAFNQEEDRKSLHHFLHELVVMVSLCHLPLASVKATVMELRTNSSNHDVLLAVLWDVVVHTSALVRCSAAKLFSLLVGSVGDNLLSTRVAPALVTLANDPEISVRISTVPTFGAILQFTIQKDLLDKAQMQLQTFLDDPLYKDQHMLHVEIIWTFGRIAAHSDPKFRDEFVLPHLVALASHNNHRPNDVKRKELALALLEAFNAIACCFLSEQLISELLLPGLRCLLCDIQLLAPEHEPAVVGMIHEFESKLELVRPHDRSGSSGGGTSSAAAASIEDVRNRVSKIFTAPDLNMASRHSIEERRKT